MALRSLDNALPTSPERPKKVAKVAVPLKNQPNFGVNDENKVPVPVTGDAAIDYIASEDLKPVTDPEIQIQSLLDGLESKDWMKVCKSLNNARRFALYHSPLLLPFMEKLVPALVKAMNNPRSALCKTSIMASSDILRTLGDNLLESTASDAFDNLLLQLLLKASQDKRFVCEEAEKALKAMVASMPPLHLLRKLQACVSHANPRVRAKASMCISLCVSKMGLEGMREFGLVSLVQVAADLLNDRLPEAREAARSTVTSIYEAVREDEEHKETELSPAETWQNFCHSNLAPTQAQSLIKIITS